MLGAVDLDELAEAGPPGPWRLAPPRALRARQPEARRRHPRAQRFDREGETVLLSELLVGEGRAEVGVPLAHEAQRLVAGRRQQPAIAGSPPTAGRQRLGTVSPKRAVEAPDLALTQPKQPRRPTPRQPTLGDPGHDLQSVQFLHRQPHRVRHRPIVGEKRTSLLWRNRTFALWAYSATSDKSRYVNFWGSTTFGQSAVATRAPPSSPCGGDAQPSVQRPTERATGARRCRVRGRGGRRAHARPL